MLICMHQLFHYTLALLAKVNNNTNNNMGMRDLPDMYAQSVRAEVRIRAYISGKSQCTCHKCLCSTSIVIVTIVTTPVG